MPRKRVFVAMSGGVDSSLAAVLLKEAGYDVRGIHMQLWSEAGLIADSDRAISDVEHTCYFLGIPLHVVNFETEFKRLVVDNFCREYGQGRTPNPCVACNSSVKFGLLLDRVLELGADYLATGHYARIERLPEGYRLLKALDRGKDQSYFLYRLGQKELKHLLFPVGKFHKSETRELTARLDLPAATRRESQDVCFIPDGDYRSFLAGRVPLEPGEIVDSTGKVLGGHRGLAFYTIGQRQGLGFSSGRRVYVVKLDAAANRVVAGFVDQLLSDTLSAGKLSWVSGNPPEETVNMTAKVRYRSPETMVQLRLGRGAAEVHFGEPQRAVAPGQAVVFYHGDAVLGGGIIEGAG